ncbi:50S ribosomal protein L6 [Candidatus Dojkabacteria bacterium]|nr:50S ribosomal protein L6 [Candidatus Dojkabacteria bacterium]
MSRIGNQPVTIEEGVEVEIVKKEVKIKGPKGEMLVELPWQINAKVEGDEVIVERSDEEKLSKSLHGTYRMLVENAVYGVKNGYEKKLEIVGVGYRGKMEAGKLNLSLGFTHPILMEVPEGLEVDMPDETTITINGVDKQLVGEYAAKIRSLRKPEPYKGKGIKYSDEVVRRKSSKSAVIGAE